MREGYSNLKRSARAASIDQYTGIVFVRRSSFISLGCFFGTINMETLRESTRFLIVEFNETINDVPVIELIPKSWLILDQGNQECWYPAHVANKKIRKWVEQEKSPASNWKKYPFKNIINEARDLDQGTRRLKRALNSLEAAASTDADSEQGGPQIQMLSVADLTASLSDNSIFPRIGDITLGANIFDGNLSTMTILAENGEDREPAPQLINDTGSWRDYLDTKLLDMEKRLSLKLDAQKKSILYDFNKKTNELKNMLAFIQTSQPQIDDESADSTRTELNTILPVKTLDEFLRFDRIIADCDGKRNGLKRLITSWIGGSGDLKAALNRTMPALISKNVQILYSGCGRKTKNQPGKLSFAATATFTCIRDVLQDKFGNEKPNPHQSIITHLSRWLAGAGDREGGRAFRMSGVTSNIDGENNNVDPTERDPIC